MSKPIRVTAVSDTSQARKDLDAIASAAKAAGDSVAGIGAPATRALGDLDKSTGKAKQSAKELGEGFEKVGEGADLSETRILGAKDAVDGVATIMAGPGEQGIAAYLQGWADLASGVANFAIPAIKAGAQAALNTAAGQKAAAAASKVWAGAQAALNLVMAANPILLVVVAIAALVAGIVLAYKNSETFRKVVDKAFGAIKDAVSSVVKFFKDMPGKIATAVGDTAKTLYNKGRAFVIGLKNGINSYVRPVLLFWTGLAGTVVRWIGDTGKSLYNKGRAFVIGLKDGINSYVRPVLLFWTGLPGTVIGWLGDTGRTLFNKGRALLIGLKSGINSYVKPVLDFFVGIPASVLRWVGDLSKTLLNAGKALIQGLIDGISSKIQAVKDKMGELTGWIRDHLPGSPVRTGPLRSWNNGGAGKRLVDTIITGMRARRGQLMGELAKISRIIDDGLAMPTSALPALELAAAPAGAGAAFGPVPVRLDVNVTVPFGVAAPEVGRQVADALDVYFTTNGPRPWSREG